MYDRILVPTDGGEHATAAARHALELAAVHGARVDALYVVETETSWLTVSKADVKETLRDVGEAAGRDALADLNALAADYDVPFTTALREGSVDEAVLAYAEDVGADCIVMGTHGRAGVSRRLLGSVAERVVRGSPVPVTTVHADD
ncbi:universal stress protein (plasmid) [Halarchaeum sp. CBA1220]|uniref:universal stress protein n=1 Tax=Halarchaeum sp. CBA1220 TaxID=1853682 RepID=UPI000F3A9943|nr:universal stress protein [Halarchaeum sp. CBA1220]QLC35319.1 universal stress protein [Halarchaeum sp. CBA1220]